MSNQYFNFYYDPSKEGFDAGVWRTVFGDIAVVGGNLSFNKAAILHYGDILRGDATFGVKIQTPSSGDDIKIGFTQYSKGVHAYFKVSGSVLTAEVKNATGTSSVVIPWVAAWTNTNTNFRIKWEAGLITFFIGGDFKAVIDGGYMIGDPMSLYVHNDSNNALVLSYITVKSIQSYLMSLGNADSKFEVFVNESEKLRITESVSVKIKDNLAINKASLINISENKTVVKPSIDLSKTVTGSLNLSEDITINII